MSSTLLSIMIGYDPDKKYERYDAPGISKFYRSSRRRFRTNTMLGAL